MVQETAELCCQKSQDPLPKIVVQPHIEPPVVNSMGPARLNADFSEASLPQTNDRLRSDEVQAQGARTSMNTAEVTTTGEDDEGTVVSLASETTNFERTTQGDAATTMGYVTATTAGVESDGENSRATDTHWSIRVNQQPGYA